MTKRKFVILIIVSLFFGFYMLGFYAEKRYVQIDDQNKLVALPSDLNEKKAEAKIKELVEVQAKERNQTKSQISDKFVANLKTEIALVVNYLNRN